MKKVLFIDRDGTILKEPPDEQIDSFDKMEFLPGVIYNLKKIAAELDFNLVMVSNQDGLGTKSFPEKNFHPVQNLMLKILNNEDINFSEIHIDRSSPSENLPTRKPGIGLLKHFLTGNYDLKNSFVIGDRKTDFELAKNLSSNAIIINKKFAPGNDFSGKLFFAPHWNDIYSYLKSGGRNASLFRSTNETSVFVEIGIDGIGKSEISTGIGFFDHMLEQLAKHSGIDMLVKVNGDIHTDEHHTIEDSGIAIGEAFYNALGSKKGIQRYGFLLPMDDCLAQVAVDFSGRSFLVWKAEFKREKIGDCPTEMFEHFFQSFADAAKCNLNIRAEGKNEHHKIEAIFKATARAIKMAVAKSGGNSLPTTKGKI